MRRKQTKKISLTVASILKMGGVGVLPTDTLYGVVGCAFNKKVVARLSQLRRKERSKPFIILISDQAILRKFGVKTTPLQSQFLQKVWPGPVSVIFSVSGRRFAYLHHGKKTLAFRVPALKSLRVLLKKTGPLLAPSANPEGLPPARTISEAKAYFGDTVDFYIASKRRLLGLPSTVVSVFGGRMKVLREGAMKL